MILATNEDLAKNVAEGTFRQDLYYRINVINIELPSLRERSSDVPMLAERLPARSARRRRAATWRDSATMPSPPCRVYCWPGNVRELQNVVERAVLLGKGSRIEACRSADSNSAPAVKPLVARSSPAGQTLKEALEGPERQIILEVLESNGWNRNATADTLGINRTTLYKKMKRLGLEDGVPAR